MRESHSGVRFKIDPIELTIQIGATRSTEGSAGVRWHIHALGGITPAVTAVRRKR